MILYIDKPIYICEEDNNEAQKYLNKFSVYNKIEGNSILIESQKISLNEENMNALFSTFFLGFNIEYGFYGGEGCPFSITLKDRKKRKVDLTWHVVDDFCACLVYEGGNPLEVSDRVAFIEKTPRVLLDGKWVQGPKGSGGDIETEGETIYGFYQPSRDWCEKQIIENTDKFEIIKKG